MKKKQVHTHTFNGIKYSILIGFFDGWADANDKYSIVVNGDLKSQKGLITLIHECLHAGNWSMQEKTVERVGEEIGSLLWRLGLRVNQE